MSAARMAAVTAASGGGIAVGGALPLGGARVPLGVGVGVVEHLGLRDLRVHALGPGLRAELALEVLYGLLDHPPCLGQVCVDETVVVLHYPAVDHHRVDIA